MIQIKELRIGNFISPMGKSVTKVEGFDIYNDMILSSDFAERKNDFFEPIPITEEWLLKFGFKDRSGTLKNEMSYGIEIGKMEIAWYRQDNKTRFQTIENGFIMKYVTYVHELQNLYFALTGNDLPLVG